MRNRVLIGLLGGSLTLGVLTALTATALDPSWLGVFLSGCTLLIYAYWIWDLITGVRRGGLDAYVRQNYGWRRRR